MYDDFGYTLQALERDDDYPSNRVGTNFVEGVTVDEYDHDYSRGGSVIVRRHRRGGIDDSQVSHFPT